MLIAKKYQVPDTCPENCPGLKQYLDQDAICMRCPVFSCTTKDNFCLIDPDDYREDWAIQWVEWFNELKSLKGA